MIPYSRQYIDSTDIKYVVKTLKSKFITQGPIIEKFEKSICKLVGAKYAVAVSSCSAGLHLAAIVSNLEKENIAHISKHFCSTANSASHCGAKLDFTDIDLDTGNMNIKEILKKLKKIKLKQLLQFILVDYQLN